MYEFSYIWEPDVRMIGPMAHELEAVAPEAVMENEDGYLVRRCDEVERASGTLQSLCLGTCGLWEWT